MNYVHKRLGYLLVAALLLGLLGRTSEAKKPPEDPPDPPPRPVEYEEVVLPSYDPERMTEAYDVNDAGTVVGRVRSFDPWGRALVWYPTYPDPPHPDPPSYDAVVDLNDRFVLPDGITLTIAGCINNDGWIAGSVDDNTTDHWGDGVFACNLDLPEPEIHLLELPTKYASSSKVGNYGLVVGVYNDITEGAARVYLWRPMDNALMIVDLVDDGGNPLTAETCRTDPEEQWVVGALDDVSTYRFDVPDLEPGMLEREITAIVIANGSGIDINEGGTIAGTAVVRRGKPKPRPARLLPQQDDWELLTSNREQWGYPRAINSQGDICGSEGTWSDQGFVFFNSPLNPDVHGFWELDVLGASTVGSRQVLGMSDLENGAPFPFIVGYAYRTDGTEPAEAFVLVPILAP